MCDVFNIFLPIFQLLVHCTKSLTNYFDDGNFFNYLPLLTKTESRQHAAAALPALLTSLAEGPFIPDAPRLVTPLQVWELHLAKSLIVVSTFCTYRSTVRNYFSHCTFNDRCNFSPRSSLPGTTISFSYAQAINAEYAMVVLNAMLDALGQCIEVLGGAGLQDAIVDIIFEELANQMRESLER